LPVGVDTGHDAGAHAGDGDLYQWTGAEDLLMPYKSDAQRRWAHTDKGTKALGGPEKVAEWDAASKGASVPERVRAGRKSPMRKTPPRGPRRGR